MALRKLFTHMQEAKQRGDKQLAVLIDPDNVQAGQVEATAALAAQAGVDYFFVGGSLLVRPGGLDDCLQLLRQHSRIPLILFPGSPLQLSNRADAILYLSLISGRNPDLLIGQQVLAAPYLRASTLEVLPTGYLLIDGGAPTTVSYMSNTTPIPHDKDDIAVCTAMAGELLGLRLLYLDAGSGARRPVSPRMIEAVSRAVDTPLVVGGGIRTSEQALAAVQAGADILVVGNAIEKDPALIRELAEVVHSFQAL